jgi:hypothetical protein
MGFYPEPIHERAEFAGREHLLKAARALFGLRVKPGSL